MLWPFDRLGARLTYQSFVDHYDDLWYPASDGVVLVAAEGVLVIDHEEQLTFARSGTI